MEKRKTIFNYISEVFAVYGIIVTIYVLLSLFIGDYVGEYSSMFRLGNKGLSNATLLQLLLLATIIIAVRNVFLTDRWIKRMSIILRNILFFITIIVVMIIMIVSFDWFPVNDWQAWVGFLISYTVSMGVSVLVSRLKERAENDKLQVALDKYNKK
ncbi:MAG: hypothetical protein GX222_04795 [Ruminococcaceae bacterium]|nr:hypothetical protein [Oscillospiraceae bacterium]